MILAKLSITNFGVYHGLHEFDLRPRRLNGDVFPVVLIGGKNGAGKTTILEAIRLCLYGRGALGSRVRKTDYETYIKQRFHRRTDGITEKSARIGILFEHVHAGEKSVFDAVRSWRIEGQRLVENVSIHKNGMALADIASEYWNDFLRDLIPPGVADLFFFDGEQIQSLADDVSESASLESAFGGLLNIDIVERLRSDLDTYIKQHGGKERSRAEEELEALVNQRASLEEVFQERYQEQAGLEARRQHIESRLARARQGLITEGAQFIEQRSAVEIHLQQNETEIQITRNQIRELSAGLLPFAFAPVWSERLRNRLRLEEEALRNQILFEYQTERANEVIARLSQNGMQSRAASRLSSHDWQEIISEIASVLLPEIPDEDGALVHHVSEQQRFRLLTQIEEVLTEIPTQMQKLGRRLEYLEQERGHLQNMLNQVPEDEIALPLVMDFQQLSEELGRICERKDEVDEALHSLEFQRNELERKRSKAWQALAQTGDVERRIDHAAKTQVVLERYLEQITAIKIEELEQLVGRYFNLLCRKDFIVKEVEIDPKHFTVALYGDNRTELPKSALSAGEKQLYAMALLWALRSVSGRQLPIIVDTPMARLDSDHRLRLLTEFFPNAAHQIILLSTDTEIDGDAFALLEPTISHVCQLDFDIKRGSTQVLNTYFNGASGEQGS